MDDQVNKSLKALSDVNHFNKYAKYIPEWGRRETFTETVSRNKAMHLKHYPHLAKDIHRVYKLVYDKKILPSMRMMQFSGKPIEINNTRGYNCAYLPIDNIAAFNETMFLLLGGTGVGFSVQRRHVGELPTIKEIPRKTDGTPVEKRYLIGDSIEGWADAVKVLMKAFMFGKAIPRFDYRDIRPKGARLKTSGGRAPGPEPLRKCLDLIREALLSKEVNEQLQPIEVYDIICHIADAVLAGGIRRAALICLFDSDDENMLTSKYPDNFNAWGPADEKKNPQRARSNNSAVHHRHEIDRDDFMNIFMRIEASKTGDPGFVFTNDPDYGYNPCQPAQATVLTKFGLRRFSEIDVGTEVWSEDGWVKITKKWSSGVKPTYRYHTPYGFFYGTEDHRVVTGGKKEKVGIAASIERLTGPQTEYLEFDSEVIKQAEQFVIDYDISTTTIPEEFFRGDMHTVGSFLKGFIAGLNTLRKKGVQKEIGREFFYQLQEMATVLGYNAFFKMTDAGVTIAYEAVKDDITEGEIVLTSSMGEQEVFHITVDGPSHTYMTGGVNVSNCVEAALRPNSFCNLTEINMSLIHTDEEFFEACEAAAFIGTLQAGYTDFHYLRDIWKTNTEFDALIGVGMTGLAKQEIMNINLKRGAEIVVETNKRIAKKININQAARTTLVKPAGTTSCILGTSSGIHAWHDRYYIRNCQLDKSSALYKYFIENHPDLVADYNEDPENMAIIGFPMKAPNDAVLREDETGIQLLERVKYISEQWCAPGHNRGPNNHNVSSTISVRDDEWDEVGEWMWENRDSYNGLAVFPYYGGYHKQTPFESCTKEQYEELLSKIGDIDLTRVVEEDDQTDLQGEIACAGGQCET